jgi:hypothetical protein
MAGLRQTTLGKQVSLGNLRGVALPLVTRFLADELYTVSKLLGISVRRGRFETLNQHPTT